MHIAPIISWQFFMIILVWYFVGILVKPCEGCYEWSHVRLFEKWSWCKYVSLFNSQPTGHIWPADEIIKKRNSFFIHCSKINISIKFNYSITQCMPYYYLATPLLLRCLALELMACDPPDQHSGIALVYLLKMTVSNSHTIFSVISVKLAIAIFVLSSIN